MIWFLIGISPFVIGLVFGLVVDPKVTLLSIVAVTMGLAAITCGVYGMYDMGWIMQCGGDTFWTAKDC